MKTLKKLPPVQLLLLALALLLGLGVMLKYAVHAQDADGGGGTWQNVDIGEAPQAGSGQTDGGGTYILSSAGRDVWSLTDSFHFQYQALNGNGQIVARMLGIEGTNLLAKAGVMVRESIAANSRNAMMLLTLGQEINFQSRWTPGGRTEQTQGGTNNQVPCWVKIVRSGDWIGGYSSVDGVNWKMVDWRTFNGLPSQIYVGLAVANNGDGVTSAAFDQVNIGLAHSGEVLNPLVGTGDGLMGSYFNNRHLYGRPVTNRVDAQVDLGFLHLSAAGITNGAILTDLCQRFLGLNKKDEFGVRWTGELQAQFTEPYTICVENDDGVRVWLDGQLIIDDWDSHYTKEDSATVNLVAGQHYLLRVEYYQNHGDLQMKLRWSSPSTPKRMIPRSQMYSQPTDADGNGLPDLWEQHYFGQTGVDPNADPDADGLSNLQEWRRQSNPTDPLNWGVPNEWTHGDIEEGYSHSNYGRAGYDNGIFTVSSAGQDIWERGDTFHYVYQSIGTNGEIVARVLGIQGTNRYAKAGVMVREGLESSARNAMLFMSVSNGMSFQWRSAFWGRTVSEAWRTNPPTPYWLKLVRNNEWVGGYVSADGTNWTLFQWETIKGLAPKVFVGLAVDASNAEGTNGMANVVTAQFDQVQTGTATEAEVMNPVTGAGGGLLASFRNDSLQYLPGLTNLVEPQVDRIWIHYRPMSIINPDCYGVCWSGEVQAQFTEPYTFVLETRSADWVRVWVNEKPIINKWGGWHRTIKLKGAVNLVAGQRYLIRVEMFNNHDKGVARLLWGSPSTPLRLVPQEQLYSQPLDADGNGLPDTWEQIYFGRTGVNPNADPDADGLSNLQEYRYHTNPLQADTDIDGMPDAWEATHGLDPQFNDADFDYDNSGWSNLQKYLYGLDPFNTDVNGDGIPDSLEVGYLGADLSTSHADLASETVLVNGAQATNYVGNWEVEGNDIICMDRRGGVDFPLTIANGDKYVLNLIGTQNQINPFEAKFKLLLGIDGQNLGYQTLNAGFGTNGLVTLVLPYLQPGTHTLKLFWDGVASYSHLRIKQVKLLSVTGADTNNNGIKDWVDQIMTDESGFDRTNLVINTLISPACVEGHDPYPLFMQLTNSQSGDLGFTATTDNRWYINVPLLSTQALVQASFQNGALKQNRLVRWQQINLLATTNNLAIRAGDSLWLTALPAGATNGNLQISYGTNILTGKAAKGIACKFTAPGLYTVTGTYTTTGGSLSGSIIVKVVQQNLPNGTPACWTRMPRILTLPDLAPGVVLQADSRLNCYLAGTNANGDMRLAIQTEDNEERTILARLGASGPVLNSTRITGFDVWSGAQAYLTIVETYPDGSQLVEMLLISSPVEPDVTFVLEPIASGVIFEDGTITKTLTASGFDALGQCRVRFIRPASVHTSVCHTIKAYQGNQQVGYR